MQADENEKKLIGELKVIIDISCGPVTFAPQWGAADAEIKVPSGENRELKRSPFKG